MTEKKKEHTEQYKRVKRRLQQKCNIDTEYMLTIWYSAHTSSDSRDVVLQIKQTNEQKAPMINRMPSLSDPVIKPQLRGDNTLWARQG